MTKEKVIVIGSGGVGAIAALALEQGGKADVTMIVRSAYDHVKEHGLEFDSVDYGNVKNWRPHTLVKTVEEAVEHGPYDYIVVCTKNIPENQKAEDLVRPLVTPGSSVVLVQNGVGNENPVMEAFPDAYVIGGVSMIGSTFYHGKISHVGPDRLAFGTLDKRPEAVAATKKLIEIYNASGKSEATFHPNIAYRRWCKLVYNASYNTVAALTGIDTGRMYFSGLAETIIMPAMKEVRAIAEAELGEKLPDNIERDMLESDDGLYYEPSMLVDVNKGQLMELEIILGNPLRSAQRTKTPAPILTTVYNLLRGKQFALLESKGLVSVPKGTFSREKDAPVKW